MGTDGHDRRCDETAEIADQVRKLRPDVIFVDAPVSGSRGPAETRGGLLDPRLGTARGRAHPGAGVLGHGSQNGLGG